MCVSINCSLKLLICYNTYTLLHELACNIVSYYTSGHGIFTSRRRVKMQPTSAIIVICMLTSVIKCLLSVSEQRLVSSHTKYQVSLVPRPPPQLSMVLSTIAVQITTIFSQLLIRVFLAVRITLCVIHTASDDSCGEGLGTRLVPSNSPFECID